MHAQPTIEKKAYHNFVSAWYAGKFGGLRFGQAFYNHFNLGKMTQTPALDKLYNADNEVAKVLVDQIFRFE